MPGMIHGVRVVRSGYALTPVPFPTLPARVRPYPRCTVTVSSACPGRIQTGTSTDRSPLFRATTSSFRTPSFPAVEGLTSATLSHVSLVIGFGSSCSHPLLAYLPSHTQGSGLSTSSSPVLSDGDSCGCADCFSEIDLGGNSEPATTPLFRVVFQNSSKEPLRFRSFQKSVMIS